MLVLKCKILNLGWEFFYFNIIKFNITIVINKIINNTIDVTERKKKKEFFFFT